ncbi:MAG: hypothetical protein ACP5D2_00145 [Candidatus Nanoarchaeia archaeon]
MQIDRDNLYKELKSHYNFIHNNYHLANTSQQLRTNLIESLERAGTLLESLADSCNNPDIAFFLNIYRDYVNFRIQSLG